MKKITLLAAFLIVAMSYGQITSLKSANRSVSDCTAGGKNPVSYPTDFGASTANYAGSSGTLNWEINENIPSNDRKFIVGEVNFTGLIPVDTPNSSIISISNSDFTLTSYANRGTANDLASDCAAAGFPAANHKKLRFNLEYTGTYTLDPYASVSVNVTITDVGAGTAARTLVVTINPDALMTVNQLQKFDFRFSPNPAKENINLSAIKNISKVEIYNLLGQKSMRVEVNAVRKTLNISELPTGIYIMQVTIDDFMGSYKIIKR